MDDALEGMEKTLARPQVQMVQGKPDWFAFRKRHPDLWIGKTGEDGSLDDWQQLLREEGQDKLTTAVMRARSTGVKGNKIRLADVLGHLGSPQTEDRASGGQGAQLAAMRSKMDLLIWCVVHSPTCYADARCRWVDGEGQTQRTVTIAGQPVTISIRERQCVDGLTAWEKLRDRAKVSQDFLFSELGKPCDARNKPAVYHSVKNDPRWIGYLRSQRLIP